MYRRLIVLCFTFTLLGCGARHHAEQVLAAYKTAVTREDIPAYVRLAEPNMRAILERHDIPKAASVTFIETITARPVRIVQSPKAVAYLGWVPVDHPGGSDYGWNLMPVVVGEGRTISKYSDLHERAGANDVTDWQVSALVNMEGWRLANAHNPGQQAAVEAALAKIDDAWLQAIYFEGSHEATKAVISQLPKP